MQNKPQSNFLELRINRDFGDIITTYFEFLKQNLKKFTNVFLSYNGIFLIGLLVVSYLLVSGFIGMITYQNNRFSGGISNSDETYIAYFIGGGILYVIILLILAVLNYSLAGGYLVQYENYKGNNFDKKDVWNFVKQRLGSVLLFVLMLILIYFGFGLVSFVLLLIPFLGMLAYYVLLFFILAWFGVAFQCLFREQKGVTEALGEGWNLVVKNFWKSVGVNFILGLLNGILLFIMLVIPGVIVGIYSFHVVENDVDITASVVPTIIYTLGTCMMLILFIYNQCLSQFVNGILYYSLHEKTYNTYTRSKIDQIGSLGE